MKPRLLATALAGLLVSSPASAQVVLDGTFGPARLVPGGIDDQGQAATYLIHDRLGQQRGGNLFHSFSEFGIRPGETATFTSDSLTPIDNVLARVTGGSESQILGRLRSTIPSADLFLMNPAGCCSGRDPHWMCLRGSM